MSGCEKTEAIAGVICALDHMNDLQNDCIALKRIHDAVKGYLHYQYFEHILRIIKVVLQEEKQHCSQCNNLHEKLCAVM